MGTVTKKDRIFKVNLKNFLWRMPWHRAYQLIIVWDWKFGKNLFMLTFLRSAKYRFRQDWRRSRRLSLHEIGVMCAQTRDQWWRRKCSWRHRVLVGSIFPNLYELKYAVSKSWNYRTKKRIDEKVQVIGRMGYRALW